jgi:hypothetical protein
MQQLCSDLVCLWQLGMPVLATHMQSSKELFTCVHASFQESKVYTSSAKLLLEMSYSSATISGILLLLLLRPMLLLWQARLQTTPLVMWHATCTTAGLRTLRS